MPVAAVVSKQGVIYASRDANYFVRRVSSLRGPGTRLARVPGPRARGFTSRGALLCDVEGRVVDGERRLQGAVLAAQEVDANRPPPVGEKVEGLEDVARRPVQVRVVGERPQRRVIRVADGDGQLVVGRRRGRLRRINLDVEGELRARRVRGDRHLLVDVVRVRGAVAVEPREPEAGVGRVTGCVGDDAGVGDPVE